MRLKTRFTVDTVYSWAGIVGCGSRCACMFAKRPCASCNQFYQVSLVYPMSISCDGPFKILEM